MDEIKLQQILNEHPDCVTNGAKLKAILLDVYPDISRAIANTLAIMANFDIIKEIVVGKSITEIDKSRYKKKLEDNYGLKEKIIDNCLNLLDSCIGCSKTNASNRVMTVSLTENTDSTKSTHTTIKQAPHPNEEVTATTASPKPTSKFITVGSIIKFGSYWQGKSQSEGKTPIEWRVLAINNNKALLISEYALDSKPFNQNLEEADWGKSTLRNWLNHFFLNAAFNKNEQTIIQLTNIVADRSKRYSRKDDFYYNFNKISYNYPCNTTDKIFLLDITEANKFFHNDEARKCTPTAYAKNKIADNDTCRWWLRSPGFNLTRAAFVIRRGTISCLGDNVNVTIDVRPALWIRFDE